MNAPAVGKLVNVFEKKLLVPIFYVPHSCDVKVRNSSGVVELIVGLAP